MFDITLRQEITIFKFSRTREESLRGKAVKFLSIERAASQGRLLEAQTHNIVIEITIDKSSFVNICIFQPVWMQE